jgi:hypothetical protein
VTRSALFVLALLLFVGGCGGPSRAQVEDAIRQAQEDAAAEEEQAQDDAGPPPEEVALEILQECALHDVSRLLDLLDVFAPLLDPMAELPPFELDSLDQENLVLYWQLDSNGDTVNDMNGSFRFEDASGTPFLPLTDEEVEQLVATGDLSILPAILESMPAGSALAMTFVQPGVADVVGNMGISFADGPVGLAGTVNILATQCTTAFRIRGINADALAGDYPDADVPITVAGAAGVLVGSVLMDGGPLATIRVTFEDTPLEFVLDLATGELVETAPQ